MTRRLVLCILGFALLSALGACKTETDRPVSPLASPTSTLQQVPESALVIKNGTVIDGTGAAPVHDGIVVVEGNRIAAVGRAADFSIPVQARIVDAKRGTILPGIINSHVHATFSPSVRRFDFLLQGVTTTCDLGAPLDTMTQFVQDDPMGPVARGLRAGPIITAPGGYPDVAGQGRQLNYAVRNPDEARAAVANLVNRGADVIKIVLETGPTGDYWPVLSKQEVKAIVEEAHARGRLVRAHVTRADLLDIALDAQVDVIEHIPVPQLAEAEWRAAVEGNGEHWKFPAAYEAQLTRMIKQHVVMVPTCSVTPAVCNLNWYNLPPEYQPLCSKLFLQVVRRFHDLGGRVALGNDYGNQGAERGIPVREMQLLVQAGLMPMEVIQAGTSRAAQVCGHGKELGTLEPGKLADIIVVDGDPLNDIQVTGHISTVVKDGQVVYH